MRIHATDDFDEKLFRKRIVIPLFKGKGKQGALVELQNEAMDFAMDYFMSFDLPSSPEITLVSMRGFEETDQPFEKVKGTITFVLKITAASQRVITLEFPFPYFKGDLLSPTIAIYGNKKLIFSQLLLDELIERCETKRPKVVKPLLYDMRIDHVENIERKPFGMPNDPSGWSELLSERYI
jgi:hypothetical protein